MYRFELKYSPTKILIIANILIYLVTSILSNSYIQTNRDVMIIFGQANFMVLQGHVWQLITSIFIHANLIHLFGNMIFLMIFGLGAEIIYGYRKFFIIYFISGLLGSILSLFLGINTISVGASGAIFGIFGSVIINSGKLNFKSVLVALIFSTYFLIINIGENVNVLAHLGGLLVGLLLGYKFTQKINEENEI